MATRNRVDFYHTSRWARESSAFRRANPLCLRCKENGLIVPSEVTDHRIPLEICPDPWDKANWDPLCKKCNNQKAAADKKLIQKHKNNHEKTT